MWSSSKENREYGKVEICNHKIKCVKSFMHFGSKTVAERNVRDKITERTKNAVKFDQLMRYIIWKWEMPNKGKICLFTTHYMPIIMYRAVEQSKYQHSNSNTEEVFKENKRKKDKRERLRNKEIREFTDKHLGTQISKYQKKVVWTYFNNQ
jgi:hypothetical protein